MIDRLYFICCYFLGSAEEKGIYVNKLEPWNSVRVTITVPREAAVKLQQLAQQGDAALSRLGILSVQVDGDQVCYQLKIDFHSLL